MARQELTNKIIETIVSDPIRVRSMLRSVLDSGTMDQLQETDAALKSGEFDKELERVSREGM